MRLTPDQITLGLMWFVAFVFSTTCHEAAHAFVAFRLGDPTAYHGGQVTLNPLPHIRREPFGMIVVPILSFVLQHWMIGWASAPYDPAWAARHPRRAAWMSLAGPAVNFLLVGASGLAIRVGMHFGLFYAPPSITSEQVTAATAGGGSLAALATLVSIVFTLNLLLGVFNLLPVPPLDGSGALPLLMPTETAVRYQSFLASQPMLAWVGLLVAWQVFGKLFDPVLRLALGVLYPGLGYH